MKKKTIVGEGQNADYQYFLLHLHCFQELSQGHLKSGSCNTELTVQQNSNNSYLL